MNTQQGIDERDRDRALARLRWLTAASGIASLAAAALATSAAAQASSPPVPASAKADPAAGFLSAEQLAALNFGLPKQGTVVLWATPGSAPAPGRAAATGPPAAAAPAPRPAPTPPPPPVATTGTS